MMHLTDVSHNYLTESQWSKLKLAQIIKMAMLSIQNLGGFEPFLTTHFGNYIAKF